MIYAGFPSFLELGLEDRQVPTFWLLSCIDAYHVWAPEPLYYKRVCGLTILMSSDSGSGAHTRRPKHLLRIKGLHYAEIPDFFPPASGGVTVHLFLHSHRTRVLYLYLYPMSMSMTCLKT